MTITTAIILAGGFGTRLRSAIGDSVPKPMAPVADKPFLAWLLQYLRTQGIEEVVLSVHFLREVIRDYIGDEFAGLRVHYAVEEEPLGTGGAMVHSLRTLYPQGFADKPPLLVLNGDSMVRLGVQAMGAFHHAHGGELTIALREMPDCSRYGEALLEGDVIDAFQYPGQAHRGWISVGNYIITPRLFAQPLPASFSFESDFTYPRARDITPRGFRTDGYFIDIGVPDDYARAQHEIPALVG
jgi:D-glycero-alpha-D-manno-heptose 1-phosphate guanylyltransferase